MEWYSASMKRVRIQDGNPTGFVALRASLVENGKVEEDKPDRTGTPRSVAPQSSTDDERNREFWPPPQPRDPNYVPPSKDNGDIDHKTGKFLMGNCGGPGNPFAAKVTRMRRAVFEACDANDVKDIIRVLVRQAKDGDSPSAKLILERWFGKPFQQLQITTDNDVLDKSEVFL